VLLTQGLSYGLQLLCTAGLLVTDEEAHKGLWATLVGLILLQGLQGLSLLIGGALAGAGQSRGLFLGTLLGMAHTSVWMVLQVLRHERLTEVTLYAQPLLFTTFGALGGLLGSVIWRPLPTVAVPLPALPNAKKKVAQSLPMLEGPIAWVRVLVGSGIVLAGLYWPKYVLDFVMNASNGKISWQSQLQAQLITWEIIGLVMLLGAALAGATTRNGLKQGLCIGIGTSILIVGTRLGNRTLVLDQTIIQVVVLLSLTAVGAWFGGQLFPPVQQLRRRRAA